MLFIDSDSLLDVILQRQPYFGASAEVINVHNSDNFQCSTSVHCLLNVHYFAKKFHGEKLARNSIQLLISKLHIISEDRHLIQQAINSHFADFEDAVQYYAALSTNASFIITRNVRDYQHSAIPVLTAEEFLRNIL